MRWRQGLLIVLVAPLAATPVSAQVLTTVSSENEAVNAAIAKAREALPVFFRRLNNPERGDSGFRVKLVYDTRIAKRTEHLWAKDVVRVGSDKISATIDNQPKDIPDLAHGQRVTVPITQISDWLYVRDGKYRGAYTVRALLPFMKPGEAAKMKERLGPE
jgi:uncharacterized protein YegJ (DUF2314 family)